VNCPAFTLYQLSSTISEYIPDDYTKEHSQVHFNALGKTILHVWVMGSRSKHNTEILYTVDIYGSTIDINAEIGRARFRSNRKYVDLTIAQLQKCQEILGHASLPFINP
jgi:hypothetical protein